MLYYYYYSYYSHQNKTKKIMQFFCPFPLKMPASSATALTIKCKKVKIENKESL